MSKKSTGGLSTLSLLGVLFIGLKLCNVIDWSWWFVLMPFYGPFLLLVIGFVLYLIIALITGKKKTKE